MDSIGSEVILQMVDEYLKSTLDLENPNHSRRIKKIAELVFFFKKKDNFFHLLLFFIQEQKKLEEKK